MTQSRLISFLSLSLLSNSVFPAPFPPPFLSFLLSFSSFSFSLSALFYSLLSVSSLFPPRRRPQENPYLSEAQRNYTGKVTNPANNRLHYKDHMKDFEGFGNTGQMGKSLAQVRSPPTSPQK